MRTCLSLAILSVAVISQAQDEGGLKKKVHHAPVVVSNVPVTVAEAEATFVKLAGLFKSVAHVTVKPTHYATKSSMPVTKAQVVSEFVRFYKAAENSFTNTPRRIHVDSGRIVAKSATEKQQLIFLIGKGFVGNFGPLATGTSVNLTPVEFGDSVGFFLTQISQCTNTSNTKYTPYLHGGN